MEFSSKLKKLRDSKDLSQLELAKILNISKQAVSNWESGRRIPDPPMLLQISNYFNVSLDYLMKDVNSDMPEEKNDNESTTIGDLAKKIINKLEEADVLTHENIADEDIWKIVIKQIRKDLEKNKNIKGDANE